MLDLKGRRLEVRRDPGAEADAALGHSYRSLRILHDTDTVSAWFAPDTKTSVAELLRQNAQYTHASF